MNLLATFTSLRVLEQTSLPAASSISSQVPHARLSHPRRNHHSELHSLDCSPIAVVALWRASMEPPSRAMQTPRSRAMRSRSSVTGARIGVTPIRSPGIRYHSVRRSKTRPSPLRLGTRIQILATAFIVVAPRWGRQWDHWRSPHEPSK